MLIRSALAVQRSKLVPMRSVLAEAVSTLGVLVVAKVFEFSGLVVECQVVRGENRPFASHAVNVAAVGDLKKKIVGADIDGPGLRGFGSMILGCLEVVVVGATTDADSVVPPHSPVVYCVATGSDVAGSLRREPTGDSRLLCRRRYYCDSSTYLYCTYSSSSCSLSLQ